MASPISFNTTNFLSTLFAMFSNGWHSAVVHNNAGSTSGGISNFVGKLSGSIVITLTSPSTFTVFNGSTSLGSGTVGSTFTSSVCDFMLTGSFVSGETFSLTCGGPATVVRDNGSELVVLLNRGTATAYLMFYSDTVGSQNCLVAKVAPSFNTSRTCANQPSTVVGNLPYAAASALTAYYRWDGRAFTLRVSDGVFCRVLSAGFLDCVVASSDYSHPLYAGGCYDSANTYAAHTVNNRSNYRTTLNTTASLITRQTSGLTMSYVTPSTTNIPLCPIIVATSSMGCFGSFPHTYLKWDNVSNSQLIATKTELLIPAWANNSTDFGNSFLMSAQL